MNTAESTETRAAFKTSLISFAKTAVQRSERVTNEEATKQYLVLPFFQLLGGVLGWFGVWVLHISVGLAVV